MQIIEIPEIKVTRYIPDDLSECDPTQYIEISALIFLLQTGQINYNEFLVKGFYRLMDMKAVNTHLDDIEKKSNIYQFSQLLNTFFEAQSFEEIQNYEPKSLKLYYTKNPIPSFIGYFRKYYGPADDFENVTFGEYLDMLEEFVNFNQTNEMIYLHRLLAIAYRPKLPFYANKVAYNANKITSRAKQFQGQHIGVVWGFYLFFASFNKYLSSCQIFVQGNEIDLSILFSSTGEDKSDLPGLGMKTVLISIAESGTYGAMEKVRSTSMWEVLIYMYYVIKKNQDQEKLYNKK